MMLVSSLYIFAAAALAISLLIFSSGTAVEAKRPLYGYSDYGNPFNATGNSVTEFVHSVTHESYRLDALLSKNVRDISVSEFHTIYRTMDGELWGSGSNRNGQLADKPPLSLFHKLTSDTVQSACAMGSQDLDPANDAGRGSTLYLTTKNKLFALGSNKYGNLGVGNIRGSDMDADPEFSSPQRVFQYGELQGKTIKTVHCGLETAYVVTKDGLLYSWGYNGQNVFATGTSSSDEIVYIPQEVVGLESGETVKEFFAGYHNGFILSSLGKLYAFGKGSSGEFGTQGAYNRFFPTELEFFGNVTKHVAAGQYYTLFLTEDASGVQTLYSTGNASLYRNGLNTSTDTPQAVKLPTTDRIATIEAAHESSYLISSKGHVYAAGHTSLLSDPIVVNTTHYDNSTCYETYSCLNTYADGNGNPLCNQTTTCGPPSMCSDFIVCTNTSIAADNSSVLCTTECSASGNCSQVTCVNNITLSNDTQLCETLVPCSQTVNYDSCDESWECGSATFENNSILCNATMDNSTAIECFYPFIVNGDTIMCRNQSCNATQNVVNCTAPVQCNRTRTFENTTLCDVFIPCNETNSTSVLSKPYYILTNSSLLNLRPGFLSTFNSTKLSNSTADRMSLIRAKTHMIFLHAIECGTHQLDSDYNVCSGQGMCLQQSDSMGYCSCKHGYANDGTFHCGICPPGTWNDQSNPTNSSCKPCPFATYNAASGSDSPGISLSEVCIACPTGSYTDQVSSPSLSSCKLCPAGEYRNDAKSGCIKCPKGYYSSVVGAVSNSTCIPCALGTYSDAEGQTSCKSCPTGSTTKQIASISDLACDSCPPGTFAEIINGIANCTQCPPGTYNTKRGSTSELSCESCPTGTYQPIFGGNSTDNCLPCPAGTYSFSQKATSLSACTLCPEGTYNERPGASSPNYCLRCDLGTYQPKKGANIQSDCLKCPVGTYGNKMAATSVAECPLCDVSKFQDETGQASCKACPDGSVAEHPGANSTDLCLPCPVGTYYLSFNGTKSCQPCPMGTYSTTPYAESIDVCKACPQGTYNPSTGSNTQDACLLCPGGTFSNVTSAHAISVCIPCAPNTFSRNGSSTCTLCPPGQLTPEGVTGAAGESSCVPAPRGFYVVVVGDEKVLHACRAGTASNKLGAQDESTCEECPVGYFSNSTNSTSCTAAPEGYHQPKKGKTYPIACPPGEYQNLPGKGLCHQCSPGFFQPNSTATSCIAADAGFYAPGSGKTKQLPCEVGKFSSSTNSSICQDCSPGYYAPSEASSLCKAARPGFYVPKSGSHEELPCDIGYYTNASASSVCDPCPLGTYNKEKNSTSCEQVGPGYYQPNATDSRQYPCEIGTYQDKAGQSFCKNCTVGFYAPHIATKNCRAAEEGYYVDVIGAFSRKPCQPGFYQNQTGQTECLPAPLGHYAPGNHTIDPSPADLGYYVNLTQSSIQYIAPPGTYVDIQGASSPKKCPVNTYRSIPGGKSALECSPCPPGSYSNKEGQVSLGACKPCDKGHYCPGERNKLPIIACPEGTYNSELSKSALSHCLVCPRGHYCLEACPDPSACKAGYYQEQLGAKSNSSCLPCPAGKYSSRSGSSSASFCLDCPAGTANSVPGNTSCAPCVPGYYASKTGQLQCQPCAAGFFMPGTNATACTSCPTGSASSKIAATSVETCVPCPSGSVAVSQNSTKCVPCSGGVCPTGSSSVLPVAKQFLEPVSQIINPQDLVSAAMSNQSVLVKWIPIAVVSFLSIISLLLFACISCCFFGPNDPCRLFSRFDMFFKLHHHVKLHDSPVKKRTILGGILSLFACTVIFCFIYSSTVDLFMNNTILSEAFKIGNIQTNNSTGDGIYRYRASLYIFGNHPDCETFSVSAKGFSGNAPVNGTCSHSYTYDDSNVESCLCRWECVDCQHEGVNQEISYSAPGVFSSVLAYEWSVPHYLKDEGTNLKRFYTINGTIMSPNNEVFYGAPNLPVQVFFSIFNSRYIKQSSVLSPLLNFVEFFGVIEQAADELTGLTTQLLSVTAGDTATIKDNDPSKGLFVTYSIELSAFIFLLEERSIQSSLNFLAQVAALSSAVITASRLVLLFFELFILQLWQQKRSYTAKKKRQKREDIELAEADLETDDEADSGDDSVREKKLGVSNQSTFGGNSAKGRFGVAIPETAAFSSDSIFADDILLSPKEKKPSAQQQPVSRVVEPAPSLNTPAPLFRRKKRKDNRKPVFHNCKLLTVSQQYQLNEWYGMKRQQWDLAYRASKHGFQGKSFHQKVDGRGPTFTIIKTDEGYIFGGFLLPDWNSENSWIRAPSADGAWLFSLYNPQMEQVVQAGGDLPDPVRIPCVDITKAAFGGKLYGPIFGAGNDVFCSNNCNENQNSNTSLGKSYQTAQLNRVSAESQQFLCGSKNFTVADVESFVLHVE